MSKENDRRKTGIKKNEKRDSVLSLLRDRLPIEADKQPGEWRI